MPLFSRQEHFCGVPSSSQLGGFTENALAYPARVIGACAIRRLSERTKG